MFSVTDASTTGRSGASAPGSTQSAAVVAGPAVRAELSEAERRKLEELRETDARVRRHEEAHRAAAGGLYRGGPNYTYETGPDGKRYAVAGSVQIDTSPGRTPEETVQKAEAIRRAALAPIDPSGTDRAIAAKASRMEEAARRALAREQFAKPAQVAEAAEAEGDEPRSSEVPAVQTRSLSPGDLGGEVWSSISALADAEQLKQERAGRDAPAGPSLDVLA